MTTPVFILGAASDIGRAIGRAYAKAGRPLILAARDPARLEADAADLRLRGAPEVTLIACDVLDVAAHAAFLDALAPFPGTVVSVVGLLGDQRANETDLIAAETVMRSNYLAPALFLGAAAERMAQAGGGTIIGISSVAGERGRASNYVYGSAKAGFTAFLSGLRNRFARGNVHVVTVKPGFVDTRMTEGMKLPPLLTAQPDEVGNAVFGAEAKRRNVVYVRPVWALVMAVIRAIPEPVFKKLKL